MAAPTPTTFTQAEVDAAVAVARNEATQSANEDIFNTLHANYRVDDQGNTLAAFSPANLQTTIQNINNCHDFTAPCNHEPELHTALGPHNDPNFSWTDMCNHVGAHCNTPAGVRAGGWQRFRSDPPEFDGTSSKYRLYKVALRSWGIENSDAPSNISAARIARSLTDSAAEWAASEQPVRMSTNLSGILIPTQMVIERMLDTMDQEFSDAGEAGRAATELTKIEQSNTTPVFEHIAKYRALVAQAGYDSRSAETINRFITSLRPRLQSRIEDWRLSERMRGEEPSLPELYSAAQQIDSTFPFKEKTPKKTETPAPRKAAGATPGRRDLPAGCTAHTGSSECPSQLKGRLGEPGQMRDWKLAQLAAQGRHATCRGRFPPGEAGYVANPPPVTPAP